MITELDEKELQTINDEQSGTISMYGDRKIIKLPEQITSSKIREKPGSVFYFYNGVIKKVR